MRAIQQPPRRSARVPSGLVSGGGGPGSPAAGGRPLPSRPPAGPSRRGGACKRGAAGRPSPKGRVLHPREAASRRPAKWGPGRAEPRPHEPGGKPGQAIWRVAAEAPAPGCSLAAVRGIAQHRSCAAAGLSSTVYSITQHPTAPRLCCGARRRRSAGTRVARPHLCPAARITFTPPGARTAGASPASHRAARRIPRGTRAARCGSGAGPASALLRLPPPPPPMGSLVETPTGPIVARERCPGRCFFCLGNLRRLPKQARR